MLRQIRLIRLEGPVLASHQAFSSNFLLVQQYVKLEAFVLAAMSRVLYSPVWCCQRTSLVPAADAVMCLVDSSAYLPITISLCPPSTCFRPLLVACKTSEAIGLLLRVDRLSATKSNRLAIEAQVPSSCPQLQQRHCLWSADKCQWHLWCYSRRQITMEDQPRARERELSVCC